jgi:hypothetical protein
MIEDQDVLVFSVACLTQNPEAKKAAARTGGDILSKAKS